MLFIFLIILETLLFTWLSYVNFIFNSFVTLNRCVLLSCFMYKLCNSYILYDNWKIGKFCSVICCSKMCSLLNPTKLNVLAKGNLHQNSKRKIIYITYLSNIMWFFKYHRDSDKFSCIIWLSCCNFGLVVSCRHEDLCTKPNSQIVTVILIQMWRNLYCKFSL